MFNPKTLSYYLHRMGGIFAPITPPAAGYAVCRVLSRFLFHLNRQAAAHVRLNLRRVFGNRLSPAQLTSYAYLTFEHILYNYFDLFRLPGLTDQTVDDIVTVHGWEHVEAALAAGKGMILTSAHLGNIEMMLCAVLLRGTTITLPVERIEPAKLFEYVTTLRSKQGLTLIPVDGSMLHLFRTLRQGGIAGLAGDRDITGSGQVCNFFDHPAYMPTGHARLAIKTGAPIVMGFIYRNVNHTYNTIFWPPFYPPQQGTESERISATTQYVVRGIEDAIRQAPEQWSLTVSIWADS